MISNKTMQYPCKRAENLSIQMVDAETLIYDETNHKAYCLNEVASAVWQHIDGQSNVKQISEAASLHRNKAVTEDAVLLALNQFQEDGLMEALPEAIPAELLSRRRMMRFALGAGVALPIVATIVAPKAAQAYNGCADC